MSSTGGNWAAPPDEQLNFSRNCDVWGAWLGAIMTPDIWNADESHSTLGTNLQKNVALLRSALPPNTPEPTYGEAIAWWIDKQQPDFPAAHCHFRHEVNYTGSSLSCRAYWNNQINLNNLTVKVPSQNCREQMCAAVSRTINPDIVGIGVSATIEPWAAESTVLLAQHLTELYQVLVSYLSEAILLTIFVGFYLLDTFTKRRRWHRRESMTTFASASDIDKGPWRPPPPVDRLDKLIDICRHCVKPFFDTAALFCISMLIAAISTVSVLLKERQDLLPSPARFLELPNLHIRTVAGFYDITLALLATIFSAFPMCILGLISDQGKRRRRLRRVTIVLAYVLGIPLVALSQVTESHSSSDGWTNEAVVCNRRGGYMYNAFLKVLLYIAIAWPLFWLYWFRRFHGWGHSGHLSWFLNGSVVVGLLSMWAVAHSVTCNEEQDHTRGWEGGHKQRAWLRASPVHVRVGPHDHGTGLHVRL